MLTKVKSPWRLVLFGNWKTPFPMSDLQHFNYNSCSRIFENTNKERTKHTTLPTNNIDHTIHRDLFGLIRFYCLCMCACVECHSSHIGEWACVSELVICAIGRYMVVWNPHMSTSAGGSLSITPKSLIVHTNLPLYVYVCAYASRCYARMILPEYIRYLDEYHATDRKEPFCVRHSNAKDVFASPLF